MTRDTLALLLDLLGQVQINVGHPDFAAQATNLAKAKDELTDALANERQHS